jgi:endonuclease/exonuclease/phosphatase family metal-dependent hydrolase
MIHKIKLFVLNLIATVNVVVVLLLLMVAYSDHLHPEDYPLLACVGMLFPFAALANLLFIPVWVFLSWKRLLIPVVGFLLAYPAVRVYLPLHGKSQPAEDAICVVSYNVCQYGGNHKYDHAFDTIFTYLKAHQADIVCVQEDYFRPNKQFGDFSRYYPYNDTTMVAGSAARGYNHIGIHTRFPILRKEVIRYSSLTNGSVAYFLQVGADTIIVINNHLESSHLTTDDRNRYQEMIQGDMKRDTAKAETVLLLNKLSKGMVIRSAQADSVHHYVMRHQGYPIILCGDFNDTPISYARRRMAEGLTDCYVESGHGPGISFSRRGFNLRIDHMMCSSHFEPVASKVDHDMDASDHYPLLCWLRFSGR